MSQDLTNNPISMVAGADLSASTNLYKVVKFDATSGGCDIAGAGAHSIGVLVSLGKAGAAVSVAIDRTCKVVAGCAIAAGNKLIAGAAGVVVTATLTTGVDSIGFAMADAAAGDIIEMFFDRQKY